MALKVGDPKFENFKRIALRNQDIFHPDGLRELTNNRFDTKDMTVLFEMRNHLKNHPNDRSPLAEKARAVVDAFEQATDGVRPEGTFTSPEEVAALTCEVRARLDKAQQDGVVTADEYENLGVLNNTFGNDGDRFNNLQNTGADRPGSRAPERSAGKPSPRSTPATMTRQPPQTGDPLGQAQTQTRAAADQARDLGLLSPEFHRDLTDGTVTRGDQLLGNLLCRTLETNILQDPRVGADMQRIKDTWMKDSAPYLAARGKYGADHPETRRAEQKYLQSGGPLFERYAASGKLNDHLAAQLRAADSLTDSVAAQRGHQNVLKELFDMPEWRSQLAKIWQLT